jgi:hypothetical protein
MQVKPILSKAAPQYPTRDFLQEHPELLRIVPERWRRNPFVLRVLAGVGCLLLAAQSAAAQERISAPASRVAPLFVHGNGWAVYGCVAINPPVFLSEDEARQVIQDEARIAGLEFTANALTVAKADVPATNDSCFDPPRTEKRDLVFDGFDKEHNVAFEFVSGKHFAAWRDRNPPRCEDDPIAEGRSGGSYNMKATAEILRSGLAAAPGLPWVGVFYDPLATPPGPACGNSMGGGDCDKAGRHLGEAQLREQVRDFIQWLKAQGVI